MGNLSKCNQAIIIAYNKGYRIINGLIHYNGKIRTPKDINDKGYYRISIRDENNKHFIMFLHRLVGYQKYGNLIFNKGFELRHLNGIKIDNSEDNIIIGTHQENIMDIPIKKRREIASNARKIHNHDAIIKMRNEGKSYKDIMKEHNISSKGTLSFIINKSMQLEVNNTN